MNPDFLDSLPFVPLLPDALLRRHHILQPLDHRFRSAARLLQAMWRADRELPIGHYRYDGKRRKLGSRISPAAAKAGANFMLPAIGHLARRECAYREAAALIDEGRLYGNLLSSMPLAFNLFGLLKLNLSFASQVLAELFPDLAGADVRTVLFEHSPGRGNPKLTGDHSAFDVFIRYTTRTGRVGFIAVELKYSESCHERAPSIQPRYDDLAEVSGLYKEPAKTELRQNTSQQFFREHLLGQAMLMRGDYDEGRFVVIAPKLNTLVADAVADYQAELKPAGEDQVGFASVTLEDTIVALAMAGEEEYAARLYRRYCDFALADGELNLFWAGDGPMKTASKPAAVTDAGPLKLLPGGRA